MIESTVIQYDVVDADSVNARFVPRRLNDLTVNLNVKNVVRTTALITATVILTKGLADTINHLLEQPMSRLIDKMRTRADKLEAETEKMEAEAKNQ